MRAIRRLLLILLALCLSACEQSEQAKDAQHATQLSVWAHAGQVSERDVLKRQLQSFDDSHPDLHVKLTFIPERSYNAQVQAAAIAGELPDLLEFDVPYLYNYAWQGRLQPLETLLPGKLRQDLLPSILAQGTYHGHLYAVGSFDSGLGLYARRSLLEQVHARIPTGPQDAWSVQEFDQILQQLAKHDADGAVLDLKLNYPDEWFCYAFSPILQSAGADLIDRRDYQHASGVLNSSAAVRAMTQLQRWLRNGLVDPNVDDAAFVSGRVALSWAGHWEYRRYHDAFGKDLLVLPLPDFGHGSRTGQGSWAWGITRKARHPQQAAQLITYLLQTPQILAMTGANAAVPATRSAIARSELYRTGGPLRLFAIQLKDGVAIPRPRTPAYPVISAAFRQAFADIRNGEPVQQTLDHAAQLIDQDIRDNHGYPPGATP
jgi:multiple sugar transport system substrate-binding protein